VGLSYLLSSHQDICLNNPIIAFLPHDATQSAVLPRQVVCLSVCPSVTLLLPSSAKVLRYREMDRTDTERYNDDDDMMVTVIVYLLLLPLVRSLSRKKSAAVIELLLPAAAPLTIAGFIDNDHDMTTSCQCHISSVRLSVCPLARSLHPLVQHSRMYCCLLHCRRPECTLPTYQTQPP